MAHIKKRMHHLEAWSKDQRGILTLILTLCPDGLYLSAVLSISCQCTGRDGNTISRQSHTLEVRDGNEEKKKFPDMSLTPFG